jgi:hypothetical protein
MTGILVYTLTSVSTTGFTVNVTSLETGATSSDVYEFRFWKNGVGVGSVYPYVWNPTSPASITTSFSVLTPGTLTYSPGDTFNLTISNRSQSATPVFPDGNVSLNNPTNNTVTVPGGGGGGGGPCFVAASNLLTPTGYKSAADIKTGDLLMTADGRKVPVKAFSFTVENANKDSAPFLLPKNSLSPSCPKADLRLSPWHAIQMKKGLWMKPMSAFELGAPIQQYDIGKSVTYYHFEAPNFFKDNLVCDNTVVESFGGLQLADVKGRVYNYNPKMKAYTRLVAKPTSKRMLM